MLRLNKLLLNDGHPQAFDARIEPTEEQRGYLIDCKNRIRDVLRVGIKEASTTALGMERQVIPRFRTQGSWSYKTCVQPAYEHQEMDWDYGVYLPVSVFEDHTPRVAARAYFSLVESLLLKLCGEEGWTLDRSKDTCIRVQVARWAHIDVPLYAVPESEFDAIRENLAVLSKRSSSAHDATYLRESAAFSEMPELGWEDLQQIHLAMRNGTWKPSDPEAVSRWFGDQVLAAGDAGRQLRRVCRYLKAWRDFTWPGRGGPSSVLIMIVTARSFAGAPRRDDVALENAARRLATAVMQAVHEPGIDDGAEDFNSLSATDRSIVATQATALADGIRNARHLDFRQRADAVARKAQLLGTRVPNQPEWVEPDSGEADVRAVAASPVPRPAVGATEAG